MRRRARDTGPSSQTRALVAKRDKDTCQRCGKAVGAGREFNLQHRMARGMGGRRGAIAEVLNEAPNLITLCGTGTTGCHGWIEAHPAEAMRTGFRVPSWADPATVPVLTHTGWLMLSHTPPVPFVYPLTAHALEHSMVSRLAA